MTHIFHSIGLGIAATILALGFLAWVKTEHRKAEKEISPAQLAACILLGVAASLLTL